MKQPKPYLLNIISAMDAIDSYRPSSEAAFLTDPKSQDAILMRLQDIGENLSRLRDLFPDFWTTNLTDAWVKAIGLRNIISHGYGDVNLAVVWVLITEDLAPFRQSVEEPLAP